MSKIQKALNALRNSHAEQNTEGGVDGGDRKVAYEQADGSGAQGHESKRSRKPKQLPNGVYLQDYQVEPVPNQSIDIDSSKLIADGLLAAGHYAEVISQQFRRIKRPILQGATESDLAIEENANVIMLASALPGAGKSFCAFNLALSISLERDFGAILVDADVLKPGISRSLGLENHVGLIDYLVNPELDISNILVATNLNNIVVVPAGRKHPEATELLASRRMQEMVNLLSAQYRNRAVIFDTPPLLVTNEAQVLASRMGQIALVIEARISSQESVSRALGMLDRSKPINAILNKSKSAMGGGYQSDDYGYYPYPQRT